MAILRQFNSYPGLGRPILWMPKDWLKVVANLHGVTLQIICRRSLHAIWRGSPPRGSLYGCAAGTTKFNTAQLLVTYFFEGRFLPISESMTIRSEVRHRGFRTGNPILHPALYANRI